MGLVVSITRISLNTMGSGTEEGSKGKACLSFRIKMSTLEIGLRGESMEEGPMSSMQPG